MIAVCGNHRSSSIFHTDICVDSSDRRHVNYIIRKVKGRRMLVAASDVESRSLLSLTEAQCDTPSHALKKSKDKLLDMAFSSPEVDTITHKLPFEKPSFSLEI